jgi:hypothetical protein
LTTIVNLLNGLVDTNNLSPTAGITAGQLADAARLGLTAGTTVRRGQTNISTTESVTSTTYTTLTTPDKVVSVVLPANGLIAVAYQATWQESVSAAARAAIFVGANQLKLASASAAGGPAVQETSLNASGGTVNQDKPLTATALGLFGGEGAQNGAYTGDVTTGQIVGELGPVSAGPCYIFAAAGTYDISIQFKASSGSVTAKNRKLWCWTLGF